MAVEFAGLQVRSWRRPDDDHSRYYSTGQSRVIMEVYVLHPCYFAIGCVMLAFATMTCAQVLCNDTDVKLRVVLPSRRLVQTITQQITAACARVATRPLVSQIGVNVRTGREHLEDRMRH